MVRVVWVDDKRCSVEELAYGLGDLVEIGDNLTNVLEAVGKVKEIKVAAMLLNNETSETGRMKAVCGPVDRASDTSIVLLVQHDQSSLKSCESDVVDNIIKPFLREQQAMMVSSLEKGVTIVAPQEAPDGKKAVYKQVDQNYPERITLWENDRIILVNIAEIACCFVQKGQRKVTVVAENKIYQCNYTLSNFLEKLKKNKMVRCHRSFAINPDYLSELLPGKNNTMVAKVAGYNREIPVSRQYSPVLRTIAGLRTRTSCKNNTDLTIDK